MGGADHVIRVFCRCEQKDQSVPDDLQHHVHRIAAAMVSVLCHVTSM